ncbi:hypothetical protein FPL20_GE00587 [Bacillus subtilis]|nr:hypothetical protein FPL20_GE00587 [Bacillus subtilis]
MGDGPPGFRRNFTCSAVLRIHSGENEVLTTGLLPPMAGLSRPLHLPRSFVTPYRVSYNPKRQASWFGLIPFRSPLLRNRICFLFLRVLRCFSSRSAFSYPMNSDMDTTPLRVVGFPIRKSPDQSLLTAPRSISVFVPSFIGS